MAKIVTVRLSDEDYVNAIEMDQILSDKRLMAKLRAGYRDAKQRKGKLIG